MKQKAVETVDVLVVGAGPAGLAAARKLQAMRPECSVLVVESAERKDGRALSGLHLLDSRRARKFEALVSPVVEQALVRWDRKWISPNDVAWDSKEWLQELPQWKHTLFHPKVRLTGFEEPSHEVPIRYRTAIRSLQALEVSDSANSAAWRVESADGVWNARMVVWASGVLAFQNAVGKHDAQKWLVGNPAYLPEAADFRGGLSLELAIPSSVAFEEGFPKQALWALPVRHGGKLSLVYGLSEEAQDNTVLRTLVHVHHEMLNDPKELVSFQKSVLRSLKNSISFEAKDLRSEKWVVSSRVGGHVLGTQWLFGRFPQASLQFVGDETIAAVEDGYFDTLGALASVNALTMQSAELSSEFSAQVL